MTEEHSSEGGIVSKSSECFYFHLTIYRLDSHDTFYTYINQLLSVRLNKLNRLISVIVSSVRFLQCKIEHFKSLNKENTLSKQPSRESVNSLSNKYDMGNKVNIKNKFNRLNRLITPSRESVDGFKSINTLKTSNRSS